MKRKPRTYLEWLIGEIAETKKARRRAYREEKRQNDETGVSADDATIYATYETTAELVALESALEMYRKFRKNP